MNQSSANFKQENHFLAYFSSLFCRETFRWEGDRRPKDYLTSEFEERMSDGGIQYKLQIQLHEIQHEDSHLVLHASRVWDQVTHPWLDLANVKLTSLIPLDVTESTRSSLENMPSSLSVFTGDRKYAGTNADVTLTITGKTEFKHCTFFTLNLLSRLCNGKILYNSEFTLSEGKDELTFDI